MMYHWKQVWQWWRNATMTRFRELVSRAHADIAASSLAHEARQRLGSWLLEYACWHRGTSFAMFSLISIDANTRYSRQSRSIRCRPCNVHRDTMLMAEEVLCVALRVVGE